MSVSPVLVSLLVLPFPLISILMFSFSFISLTKTPFSFLSTSFFRRQIHTNVGKEIPVKVENNESDKAVSLESKKEAEPLPKSSEPKADGNKKIPRNKPSSCVFVARYIRSPLCLFNPNESGCRS